MSFRTICNHASTATTAVLTKSFSSSASASTSKLSPLNKTTLLRAERLAKGLGKGKKAQEKDSMTIEEAARTLQVSHQTSTIFFHSLFPSFRPTRADRLSSVPSLRPGPQLPQTPLSSSTSKPSPPQRSSSTHSEGEFSCPIPAPRPRNRPSSSSSHLVLKPSPRERQGRTKWAEKSSSRRF